MKARRYWINSPSSYHPQHKFHGVQVLGPTYLNKKIVTVYPNSGPTISLRVLASSLSWYWKGHDNI